MSRGIILLRKEGRKEEWKESRKGDTVSDEKDSDNNNGNSSGNGGNGGSGSGSSSSSGGGIRGHKGQLQ